MDAPAYPLLFSPLRRRSAPSSATASCCRAMTTGFGFEQGVPDEASCAYLRARSGGVGMATVAFGAVAPEGRVEEKLPWMWRDDIADRDSRRSRPRCTRGGAGVPPARPRRPPGLAEGDRARPGRALRRAAAASHVKQPPRALTLGRDRGDRRGASAVPRPRRRRRLRRRRGARRPRLPRPPVPLRPRQPARRTATAAPRWPSGRASASRSCRAIAARGTGPRARRAPERLRHHARRDRARRRARGRARCSRRPEPHAFVVSAGRLRLGAVHDPDARRRGGRARRARRPRS